MHGTNTNHMIIIIARLSTNCINEIVFRKFLNRSKSTRNNVSNYRIDGIYKTYAYLRWYQNTDNIYRANNIRYNRPSTKPMSRKLYIYYFLLKFEIITTSLNRREEAVRFKGYSSQHFRKITRIRLNSR